LAITPSRLIVERFWNVIGQKKIIALNVFMRAAAGAKALVRIAVIKHYVAFLAVAPQVL